MEATLDPPRRAASEPLIQYSLENFRELILQILELAGARRIVEVGSEYGAFTPALHDYARSRGGGLVSIEPSPKPQAIEFVRAHESDPHFAFEPRTSLEALPDLAPADVYVIDGDHNYFTVLAELEVIARQLRASSHPLLVLEHDVCWPCGRRDAYYAPERIPEPSRRPHAYRTVTLGERGLVDHGFGDPSSVAFALEEGGAANGVRTAIEDFLATNPELRFLVVPAFLGLGILYSADAPWAERLEALVRPLAESPLVERLEHNRLRLLLDVLRSQAAERDGSPRASFLWGPYPLEIFFVRDRRGFDALFQGRILRRLADQEALIPPGYERFVVPGICVVCERPVEFVSDYMFTTPDPSGKRVPAWRERQVCGCGLNCRQRSCFHLLSQMPGLSPDSEIYLLGQTDLAPQVVPRFRSVVVSEYLGDAVPLGSADPSGIRNEDVTRLTFPAESFDCIFNLDVLEHVPDYRKGLREMARCLRPGGWLVMTVPLMFDQDETVVRARMGADGAVEHLLPPVVHGDPLDPKGVLCFNDFGWDLLAEIESAGFPEPELAIFTAPHYGYVGLQYVFVAQKADPPATTEGCTRGPG